MQPISLAHLRPIVESFLAGPARDLDESRKLSDLGIDSLTTLNILMSAAEAFGLDLAKLDETASAPVTIRDVMSLLEDLRSPSESTAT